MLIFNPNGPFISASWDIYRESICYRYRCTSYGHREPCRVAYYPASSLRHDRRIKITAICRPVFGARRPRSASTGGWPLFKARISKHAIQTADTSIYRLVDIGQRPPARGWSKPRHGGQTRQPSQGHQKTNTTAYIQAVVKSSSASVNDFIPVPARTKTLPQRTEHSHLHTKP